MKRLIVCGTVAFAAVAGITVGQERGEPQRQTAAAKEPFEVQRCYRVFPQNRDQFYLFRVVGVPSGPWIPVQTEPAPLRVPGSPPPAPLGLNGNGLFAVQECSCAD